MRTWNHVYVYRIGDDYRIDLVLSEQIDDERPGISGTVEIGLLGSRLRVYGVGRTLELDLERCQDGCNAETIPFVAPPGNPSSPGRCSVRRGSFLFGVTTATTRAVGIAYHDIYLSRRRVVTVGVPVVSNPYRPESVLYLGTREETGG